MMFLKLHKEGEPLRVNPDHVEAYLSRPVGPGPGAMTMTTEVGLRAGATVCVDETPAEIDKIINLAAGRPGVWSLDRVRREAETKRGVSDIVARAFSDDTPQGPSTKGPAPAVKMTRHKVDPGRSVDEIIAVIDAAYSVARKVWTFAEDCAWEAHGHRHLNLEKLGDFLDKSFPGWRKADSAPADPYDEDEAEGPWVRARQQADADEWEPEDERPPCRCPVCHYGDEFTPVDCDEPGAAYDAEDLAAIDDAAQEAGAERDEAGGPGGPR